MTSTIVQIKLIIKMKESSNRIKDAQVIFKMIKNKTNVTLM